MYVVVGEGAPTPPRVEARLAIVPILVDQRGDGPGG